MAAPSAIPPNIAELTAPLLIGALLNYAFYGVLVTQVVIYHIAFPADRKPIKALVYIVLILETVQVCLAAANIYYWFASGYGNLEHFGRIHFSAIADPLMAAISALITQGFFCYRIWILKKETIWLCIIISCISVVQFGGALSSCIVALRAGTFEKAVHDRRDSYLWLVSNAVADLLIAVSLTFLLLRQRREDQPLRNNLLVRIVRMVIETNGLTSAVAVVSVILFLALQDAPHFIFLTSYLGKLYSNSLLVSLNNRLLFIPRVSNRGQVLSSFEAAGTSGGHHLVELGEEIKGTKNQLNSLSSLPGENTLT